MKTFASATSWAVMLLLLFGFGMQSITYAQQSDYQIVRNYQNDYNALLEALKSVDSVEEAEELIEQINQLNNEYGEYSSLINRYIHPEDFDGQVFNLRELTSVTRHNMQQIAEREAEIEQLNTTIADLNTQLEEASAESDQLREDLDRMTRDRNANAAMVRNLRGQLEERDEFILGLVDSVFVSYDNIDLASLSPGEQREFALRADADNVVGHVNSVVESNIAFIDTHTQLSSADFLALRSNFVRFRDSWSNLGSRLAEIYEAADRRDDKVSDVNDRIATWGDRLDQVLWRSIAASFEGRDIDLDSFNSASSFYQALNRYLDDALARVEESGGSEEELARYENFANVWHNDVKTNWQEHLVEGEVLSFENIATIDRKLSDWNVSAQPATTNWLIIVGILGLIIIVLIVLLVTRSKGGDKPRPSSGSSAPSTAKA